VSRWRVARKCADCPFAKKGAGLKLRRSLRPGRFAEILRGLRREGYFICHKTTRQTGNGTNLVCAGSIEWQEKRGLTSQYQRICERLAAFREAAR
jgi:hypothetical protein